MATTTTYSLEKPTVGGSENTWGTDWNDNADKIDDLLDGTIAIKPNLDEGLWEVGGVAVTATAAELNILDGVTASTAELNILDGVTATTAELNILDGVTATTAELNILDGVTATTAELNILDGVTATTAELNILDGVTATAAEINLLDGLTAIVTASSGIASNDNDTTIPTSAAVKAYADVSGVGGGQTWQAPTRALATIYQNTTGKPIQVILQGLNFTFQVSSDNFSSDTVSLIGSGGAGFDRPASAVIPNNYYYRALNDGGGSIVLWRELR